jgi:hypothetical protein
MTRWSFFYVYPNGVLFIGFCNKKHHVFLIMVVWWCIKNCNYWVCYLWNACHIVWFFFNKIQLLSNLKCVLNFWSFCCWWFLLPHFFGYTCTSLFSCFFVCCYISCNFVLFSFIDVVLFCARHKLYNPLYLATSHLILIHALLIFQLYHCLLS